MFPENHDFQKLRKIILGRYPNSSEEKIERLVTQYSELGIFLVHLWARNQNGAPKTGLATDFQEKPRDSPTK